MIDQFEDCNDSPFGSFRISCISLCFYCDWSRMKDGETPAVLEEDAATAKSRQKDVDARWTKKHGKSFYGYKNHICVDVDWKLIREYVTTPANVHDINVLEDLVDPIQKGQLLYADAGYRAEQVERALSAQRIRVGL